MPRTVILGSARTPVGKMGGGLSSLHSTDLGGIAIGAALERADVAPDEVQHVIMGQVLQAGQGQIPSRQAQVKAGIPKEVSSETINKVCASGLRASVIAVPPRSVASREESPPPIFPKGVLAVERMTVFDICTFRLRRRRRRSAVPKSDSMLVTRCNLPPPCGSR